MSNEIPFARLMSTITAASGTALVDDPSALTSYADDVEVRPVGAVDPTRCPSGAPSAPVTTTCCSKDLRRRSRSSSACSSRTSPERSCEPRAGTTEPPVGRVRDAHHRGCRGAVSRRSGRLAGVAGQAAQHACGLRHGSPALSTDRAWTVRRVLVLPPEHVVIRLTWPDAAQAPPSVNRCPCVVLNNANCPIDAVY
jgi:hypothetical protein